MNNTCARNYIIYTLRAFQASQITSTLRAFQVSQITSTLRAFQVSQTTSTLRAFLDSQTSNYLIKTITEIYWLREMGLDYVRPNNVWTSLTIHSHIDHPNWTNVKQINKCIYINLFHKFVSQTCRDKYIFFVLSTSE